MNQFFFLNNINANHDSCIEQWSFFIVQSSEVCMCVCGEVCDPNGDKTFGSIKLKKKKIYIEL